MNNQESSYKDMYNQLYGGNNQQNNYFGPSQLDLQYQQMQNSMNRSMNQSYSQNANVNMGINKIKPQDNYIVDREANREHILHGYGEETSLNTSQYGLVDLDASDWFKYSMFLLIPIFNIFFFMYYGFFKSFIQYPSLKEWSKSVILPCVCIDVMYFLLVFIFI